MDARQTSDEPPDNDQEPRSLDDMRERLCRIERHARVLETTLSHIPDFAYIFDREGRFIYANQAILNLWGLTLDEAAGKNFFDLRYPDELATKLQRQIQQVFDTGLGLKDETPYVSPTGKGGIYEYIFRPVIASDGTVEMVAGSTRDITEREQLLQSLQLERSRMTYIFEHSLSFVALLRGPEHVVEMVNPPYRQLIGGRDAVGKSVREALPEAAGQGFFALLDNVYRTGEPYIGQEMLIHLNRAGRLDEMFLNFVYQPIFEADGTVSGIFVHGVDVT